MLLNDGPVFPAAWTTKIPAFTAERSAISIGLKKVATPGGRLFGVIDKLIISTPSWAAYRHYVTTIRTPDGESALRINISSWLYTQSVPLAVHQMKHNDKLAHSRLLGNQHCWQWFGSVCLHSSNRWQEYINLRNVQSHIWAVISHCLILILMDYIRHCIYEEILNEWTRGRHKIWVLPNRPGQKGDLGASNRMVWSCKCQMH